MLSNVVGVLAAMFCAVAFVAPLVLWRDRKGSTPLWLLVGWFALGCVTLVLFLA